MKKLLFLVLLLPILLFSQTQGEVWTRISDLLEMPQKSLIVRLPEGTCIGSSMGYTHYEQGFEKVSISYDKNSIPNRLEIENFEDIEHFKELLIEGNLFIPIKGYRTYRAYYSNNGYLTLIRE